MDVDRAVEDLGASCAVDRVEQLVAGEDAAVGGEDRLEQPELDAGQVDRPAVAGHLVAVAVERSGRRGRSGGRVAAVEASAGAARRRIDFTRRTSSAGENGLGR